MNKKNIALLGYGYWGKKLYSYLKKSEQFHLKYVHFRSLKNLTQENIGKEYGAEFVPDIERVWRDEDVGQVVIATPIITHYALTKQALMNNKNVLVEKPITMTGQEAHELQSLAKEKKKVLMTEYTFTFSKALKMAQKMINEGVIGDLKSIDVFIRQLGRFTDYDVYALIGSHALSIINLFLPLNTMQFSAQTTMVTNDVITSGIITFQTKDARVKGFIDLSLHCPDSEKKVFIYGEQGTIIYDCMVPDSVKLSVYRQDKNVLDPDLIREEKSFQIDESHNLRLALEDFFEGLRNRQDNLEGSVAVTEVLDALRCS